MIKPLRVDRALALAKLCQFDLLSAEEERRLFRRFKELKTQASRSHRRTAARETFAGEAVAIRNRIVECNLRLVVSLAKRFTSPEQPIDELVGTAALPLIRCVERFDADRGTRFSTYATRALIHFFARLCRNRRRRRLPTCDSEALNHIAAAESGDEALDRLIRAENLSQLHEQFLRMPNRERSFIAGRFGLTADRRPRTFRELGKMHGLSKERARVVTSQGISRLQQALRD